MSNAVSISVEKREDLGSAHSRRLRKTGKIPAILYGHGAENITLCVTEGNAAKLLGHTGMVDLNSDSLGKRTAVLKEVTHNPINGKIIHIDFQAVKDDELITVPVPVMSFGEAAGLKQGGQLEQVLRELEIECLPANVPEVIKVDVSSLQMDQAFHISDLKLADGLRVLGDGELTIFHVRAPRTNVETSEEAGEEEEEKEAAGESDDAAAQAKKKA